MSGIIITERGTEDMEMKKYNLSKIMKRAWEMKKNWNCRALTFAQCLKRAWEEAKADNRKEDKKSEKAIKEKFEKCIKILKMEKNGNRISDYLTFSLWEKYGKRRVYVNDYKKRTIGYIENGLFNLMDNQGNYTDVIEDSVERFMAKYEF